MNGLKNRHRGAAHALGTLRTGLHPLSHYRIEWLALAAVAVGLIGRCYFESLSRPLWFDEVLTAFAVSDRSLPHMLTSLADEINAMPPLTFVIGWAVARFAGVSDFALRVPSTIAAWGAVVFLWVCLHRYVGRAVALWSALCLPVLTSQFLYYSTEARCYSLYFASFTAPVALYLKCAEEVPFLRYHAWLVTCAHAVLVALHYIGGLLSALLVFAALVVWAICRDRRWLHYATHGMIAWVAALPSVPFYLAQRWLGGEGNWMLPPTIFALAKAVVPGIVTLTALFFAMRLEKGKPTGDVRMPASSVMRALTVLVALSVAFVVVVWVESHFAIKLFLYRYFFPLSVPWMISLAIVSDMLATSLWEANDRGTAGTTILGVRSRKLLLRGAFVAIAVALTATTAFNAIHLRPAEANLMEAMELLKQHPQLTTVARDALASIPLAWYRRGSTPGVVMLDDSVYSGRFTAMVRISTALERQYLPGLRKNLSECVSELNSFLLVKGLSERRERGDIEHSLKDDLRWEAVRVGRYTSLWHRRD